MSQACSSTVPPSQAQARALVLQGRRLQYVGIAWMFVEAAVGIGAGIIAGSVALVAFGADSVIELFSSSVLLWRLREGPVGERRERMALKLVAASLFALAAYVAVEAIADLVRGREPDASYTGIALAAVALAAMPLLARAKRRVAAGLRSEAMHADSRQTDFCAWLAGILLAGLALNAWLHWWWADPAAALFMAPVIIREGVRALRGETCCECEG